MRDLIKKILTFYKNHPIKFMLMDMVVYFILAFIFIQDALYSFIAVVALFAVWLISYVITSKLLNKVLKRLKNIL